MVSIAFAGQRVKYSGVARTSTGTIIDSATVSVFLNNTTPANVYTTEVGGTGAASVTTDSNGAWTFWVDLSEYTFSQKYKIIVTKGTATSTTSDIFSLALPTNAIGYLYNDGVGNYVWTTPAGTGDMVKAVYDTDANDKIDANKIDALSESNLTLSAVTTNNATAARHGFLPILSNVSTECLKGDGTWGACGLGDITSVGSDCTTGACSAFTIGGIGLGVANPSVDGGYGYYTTGVKAFRWYANSQDWYIAATSDLWTFGSYTGSVKFAFTPLVTFNAGIDVKNGSSPGFIKLYKGAQAVSILAPTVEGTSYSLSTPTAAPTTASDFLSCAITTGECVWVPQSSITGTVDTAGTNVWTGTNTFDNTVVFRKTDETPIMSMPSAPPDSNSFPVVSSDGSTGWITVASVTATNTTKVTIGSATSGQLACWNADETTMDSCGAPITDNSSVDAAKALCKDNANQIVDCTLVGIALTGTATPTITGIGGTLGATANALSKRGADANTIAASTITENGTTVDFQALNLVTSGTIQGKLNVISDDITLAASQVYGSVIKMSGGAETATLPAAVVGMNVLFYAAAAGVKNIDPNGTDTIVLTTAALAAGYQIESPGVVGDFIALVCLTANQWTAMGRSGVWVTHGAD